MEAEIIGRENEKAILDDVISASTAHLVAVYGRRRVGKTYLIRTYLKKHITFEYSGVHDVTTEIQLEKFAKKISETFNANLPILVPNNWFDALDILKLQLQKKLRRKKAVVFLDEFPWMQTHGSNFLAAFENFWNTWASLQNNLVIILCGSAASWMIKNVVRNRGGLHNRITQKIALQPFTLYETEAYLKSRKVNLNHYQITQIYMAMGGIPHYLSRIQPGQSAAQIIQANCFEKNGPLHNEFTDLFYSLFDNPERYISIIRALANKSMGLNRTQLITTCKLQSGGSASAFLDELTSSGFITAYIPLGKQTKNGIYKLTDAFSLFYLKFMEANRTGEKGTWQKLSNTQTWKSWSGLAFESVCLLHTEAIKQVLGIAGIYTDTTIWKSTKQASSGAQIDLVINRNDNCINLCEMKFYENNFSIDKNYATQLQNKKDIFKQETKTKKQLFITMVTTYPIEQNINSIGLIDNNITLEKLFTKTEM
jgi:uncharacterized protein